MMSLLAIIPVIMLAPLSITRDSQQDLLWTATQTKQFALKTTGTWEEFKLENTQAKFQHEKWAWIGSIIFKSKQALTLKNLNLQWIGDTIPKLHASLYQKKFNEKNVLPIQDNLICDGTWDPLKQQITFRLNEKIVAINKYCLVLSFSSEFESKLKKGKFLLAQQNPFTVFEIK